VVDERFNEARSSNATSNLSSISLFEFEYGLERSGRRQAHLEVFQRFRSVVEIADLNEDDAVAAASVKAKLAAQGQLIGPYDLLIAGQALARGWTLVTSHAREFTRMAGLTVEDWRAPA
jgi:tRNA(fMet)-specific endonuclease VapC